MVEITRPVVEEVKRSFSLVKVSQLQQTLYMIIVHWPPVWLIQQTQLPSNQTWTMCEWKEMEVISVALDCLHDIIICVLLTRT